ncbi:uncharacterized protein [Rutidosis leptorrhynchoides]|uniref:uncharacterized protein n=1 Tax=Rutidosis leptorrhynchoides TaxID=125765 RepID=UPI003A99BB8D
MCQTGTRIIIGWNPDIVNVMVVALTDQVVHCLVRMVQDNKQMFASFVYASNSYIERRILWKDLVMHKGFVGEYPWTILGDFNASIGVDESTSGASRMTIAMREFKECIDTLQVEDLNYPGINYTWNQSPNEMNGMLKKIDRVLVNAAFLSTYPQAYDHANRVHVDPSSFTSKLSREMAANMIRPVTNEDIKLAMFGIGEDKASGPDGYSSSFFKKAWDVVGDEVGCAIKEFFKNGQLLTEINHTILTLLLKVKSPSKVNDYRPISCCNVLYKCISKIITSRIKGALDVIISNNQSAFVSGRRIFDNILLTQEIMKNYHLDRGIPRCAFKVDIQKAYDTVDWEFLKEVLQGFGFHKIMIKWIMKCVSTTSFSISINGELHGHFKGKRGLRQGDPMSPYLFTMVMEILTLLFQWNINNNQEFTYHPKCESQKIVNVCFADDLFIFSYANMESVMIIADALEEFKNCSGLVPSFQKSTAFFAGVNKHIKDAILMVMPFVVGSLPVICLGVPLISTRLYHKDCKGLVDRLKRKIDDWKNKYLSFAGRVQLITSVLSSMQVYWSSVFMLSDSVIKEMEKIMRGFLWCQGEMKQGKAKVKWSTVYLPKSEGGLGIKSLKTWNIALMVYHIWNIITCKQTLWVKWIHTYRLQNHNFWVVDNVASGSWVWRKILSIRQLVRHLIVHVVGNGSNTSAWFDSWTDFGPLAQIQVPNTTQEDKVGWKDSNGELVEFSSKAAWESLRNRTTPVDWFQMVWFSNSIPRHTFMMWLLMDEKLKTQDKLHVWDVGSSNQGSPICALCSLQQDSHNHLFFECTFSKQLWSKVKKFIVIPGIGYNWKDIMQLLIPYAHRRVARMLVAKFLLAATVYFIWQERNARLFKGESRDRNKLFNIIYGTVRLKLMSVKFKESHQVKQETDVIAVNFCGTIDGSLVVVAGELLPLPPLTIFNPSRRVSVLLGGGGVLDERAGKLLNNGWRAEWRVAG